MALGPAGVTLGNVDFSSQVAQRCREEGVPIKWEEAGDMSGGSEP